MKTKLPIAFFAALLLVGLTLHWLRTRSPSPIAGHGTTTVAQRATPSSARVARHRSTPPAERAPPIDPTRAVLPPGTVPVAAIAPPPIDSSLRLPPPPIEPRDPLRHRPTMQPELVERRGRP